MYTLRFCRKNKWEDSEGGLIPTRLSTNWVSWTAAPILVFIIVSTIPVLSPIFLPADSIAEEAVENPYELFEQAKTLQNEGKNRQAVTFYTEAIEKFGPDDPNSLLVRVARARALMSLRKLEQAKDDLRTVLKDDRISSETEATAWHVVGLIKLRERDNKKAKEAFTKAIKVRHDNNELKGASYANRALTFTKMDKPDKALSDIGQALQLHPDYAYAYAVAAVARLKEQDPDQAEKNANQALSMNPDSNTRSLAEGVLKQSELFRAQRKMVNKYKERFQKQAKEFEEATDRLAGTTPVLFQSRDRLILNIGRSGHIFVKVSFGRHGKPTTFMLDTGATYSLVSQAQMKRIRKSTEVKEIRRGLARIADGSLQQSIWYLVKDAYLYGLPLGDIEVGVMANEMAVPMNLLGVKSLRNVRIAIDPSTNKAEIRLVSR